MWQAAEPLVLTDAERAALTRIVQGRNSPQKMVLRARIVLSAAQGQANNAMAKTLATNRLRRGLVESVPSLVGV